MATNSPRISSTCWVRGALQALAQQRDDLAVGAAALGGVLVEQHAVEGRAEDLRLLADVLVAAVAGGADDHAAALRRHGLDGSHQARIASGLWP